MVSCMLLQQLEATMSWFALLVKTDFIRLQSSAKSSLLLGLIFVTNSLHMFH